MEPSLPLQLDLAVHVQNYAREYPNEDVEASAETGVDHETLAWTSWVCRVAKLLFSSDQPAAHGQKRPDEVEQDETQKRVKFADAAFSSVERTFLLDETAIGESAPKTPKVGWWCTEENAESVTRIDLSLYEHEDGVRFAFNNDELGELEEYELNPMTSSTKVRSLATMN